MEINEMNVNSTTTDGNRIKCALCKKEFTRKSSLVDHKKIHEINRKKLKCSKCHTWFSKPANLLKHCKDFHPKAKNVFQKSFQKGMQNAPKTSIAKNYECFICGKNYKLKATLKEHLNDVHIGRNKANCDLCSTSFRNTAGLRKHTKLFHNPNPILPMPSNASILQSQIDFDITFASWRAGECNGLNSQIDNCDSGTFKIISENFHSKTVKNPFLLHRLYAVAIPNTAVVEIV